MKEYKKSTKEMASVEQSYTIRCGTAFYFRLDPKIGQPGLGTSGLNKQSDCLVGLRASTPCLNALGSQSTAWIVMSDLETSASLTALREHTV